MLDFMTISSRTTKSGVEVSPKFIVRKSKDLMVRGGDFYAVWDDEKKMWSTDEDDVVRLVDAEIKKHCDEHFGGDDDGIVTAKYMWDADSLIIDKWHKYCQKQRRDSYIMLDEELIFSNTELTREKYASKRLEYPLEEGSITAYEKIISTLYNEADRHKIEWAIGSIVSGDSKHIQKFIVLYGAAGTGKSTILNIIQQLFKGYCCVFDAKALGSNGSQFALEAFKNNPLVAIQHDGDLSKIEDNTRINSLVSHEEMVVNEKYTKGYTNRFKCFLFMGTNKPVKITDSKSGLLRRLIDVNPSGNKLGRNEYRRCMKQVEFELGAIAKHCLDVYMSDPGYYDDYVPTSMMEATNDFFNFMIDSYRVFKKEDGTTVKAAWEMYKNYCDEAKVPYPFSQRTFIEELKNYFWDYDEKLSLSDGNTVSRYFSGFRTEKFEMNKPERRVEEKVEDSWLKFDSIESIFDKECADCFAQYANVEEKPSFKWDNVKTKLSELDTSKLHYAKMADERHIVVDFDIKDKNGNKSLELNIEAASKWPATYAELSKSGAGVHLHYIYTGGDVNMLSRVYDENIEIKVFTGNSSLRRKLTKCNNLPIANISSGLPLKETDKVINFDGIKSEKMLRMMIKRNLNKEYHPATKPSIDLIYKHLEDSYNSGLNYDVSDMQNAVFAFAAQSTNQADYCIKLVSKMKFKSEEILEGQDYEVPIVFYDIEVFPNLFIICWKQQGEGKPIVRMINPKPKDVEELMRFRLIGFNNRKYDNHIIYAAHMGYSNEGLYNLSQSIINEKKGFFGSAYNISYTDIYDYAAKKQSLKKWEIDLGISHVELGLPWDKPVPEELWEKVAEYCDNDVIATEAVFDVTQADFSTRKLLAELSGLTPNDPNRLHINRIIFGYEKKPILVYTDFATGEQFEGR